MDVKLIQELFTSHFDCVPWLEIYFYYSDEDGTYFSVNNDDYLDFELGFYVHLLATKEQPNVLMFDSGTFSANIFHCLMPRLKRNKDTVTYSLQLDGFNFSATDTTFHLLDFVKRRIFNNFMTEAKRAGRLSCGSSEDTHVKLFSPMSIATGASEQKRKSEAVMYEYSTAILDFAEMCRFQKMMMLKEVTEKRVAKTRENQMGESLPPRTELLSYLEIDDHETLKEHVKSKTYIPFSERRKTNVLPKRKRIIQDEDEESTDFS